MNNDCVRNLRLVHSSSRPEPSTAARQASTGQGEATAAEHEVPPFDAEVRALLQYGRIIVPLPPVVRARALARARAAVATLAEPTATRALGRARRH